MKTTNSSECELTVSPPAPLDATVREATGQSVQVKRALLKAGGVASPASRVGVADEDVTEVLVQYPQGRLQASRLRALGLVDDHGGIHFVKLSDQTAFGAWNSY